MRRERRVSYLRGRRPDVLAPAHSRHGRAHATGWLRVLRSGDRLAASGPIQSGPVPGAKGVGSVSCPGTSRAERTRLWHYRKSIQVLFILDHVIAHREARLVKVSLWRFRGTISILWVSSSIGSMPAV